MPKRGANLTVAQRILLHLLQYTIREGEVVVPHEVTQAGMSRAIGIRQSHVSYEAQLLQDKGFLASDSYHVDGVKRRMKGYSLTREGRRRGKAILDEVSAQNVKVRSEGKTRSMTVGDLFQMFRELPHAQVLQHVGTGTVDASKLSALSAEEPPERPVAPQRFYGRRRELELMSEWLKRDGEPFLVVTGIAGIGKTTLVQHFLSEYWNGEHFSFQCREWSTVRGVVEKLSLHLARVGHPALSVTVAGKEVLDLEVTVELMTRDLSNRRHLFVFDDVQRAGLEELWRALFEVGIGSRAKFILASRRALRFREAMGEARGRVAHLELEGLDPKAARKVLQDRKLEGKVVNELVEATGGHPLCLQLANSPSDLCSEVGISKFLDGDVLYGIDDKGMELLKYLSTFRAPVGLDAVTGQGFDYDVLEGLLSRYLVKPEGDLYSVHEVISEHVRERLTSEERRGLHSMAADHFLSQATASSLIEAAHHLECAGANDEAASTLIDNRWLLRSGHHDELNELLDRLEGSKLSEATRLDLVLLHADMLIKSGDWEDAGLILSGLEAMEGGMEPAGRSELNLLVAALRYRQGDMNGARVALELARKEANRAEEMFLLSDILNLEGVLDWESGDMSRAEKSYMKALAICQGLRDKRGMAKLYNNLALVKWRQEKLGDAKGWYERSMKLARETEDAQTLSSALANMGDLSKDMGDLDAAREYYASSLREAERIGFLWQVGESKRSLAMISRGRERSELLQGALEIFTSLGAKGDAQKTRVELGR